MTQHERICHMTVEEMAELLTGYNEDTDEYTSADGHFFGYMEGSKAIAASLAYLKSEAKE